ncbi:unnamed protein product [Caenorhabditis brenneri]
MNSFFFGYDTSTIAARTKGEEIPPVIGILFIVLALLIMVAPEVYIYFKAKQERPITLTPVIPFPQDKLQVFKGTQQFKNLIPDAKIQYGVESKRPVICFNFWKSKYDYYATLNQFMAWTFKLDSRLPHEYEEVRTETTDRHYRIKPKLSLPYNARTISIKMNGYEHGENCHDFVPIGGAAPGSHFTYQMYGDNRIQVTRYVVDGKSEIAGFCIYIEHPWLSKKEFRWNLLYKMARSATTSTMPEIARYVETAENPQVTEERRNETNQPKETTELLSQESSEDDREWAVKYCPKRRRKVMTSLDSDEFVVHQEWDNRSNQMKIEKCEECTKEGFGKEEQPPAYSSIFIV